MKNLQFVLVILLLCFISCGRVAEKEYAGESTVPSFTVDPFWPKSLPGNWLIGQVSGIATDSKDNVWIIHRPASLGEHEAASLPVETFPFTPAPPVLAFDHEGNLLRAWGGKGDGFEWSQSEHGIFIDHQDNIWINGGGPGNHQVLKFSQDGAFLLAIGRPGETGGNNNTLLLGYPTEVDVDPCENEVYIADGYVNNRIIVFDAVTGKYKRHWGAYGKSPPIQFSIWIAM